MKELSTPIYIYHESIRTLQAPSPTIRIILWICKIPLCRLKSVVALTRGWLSNARWVQHGSGSTCSSQPRIHLTTKHRTFTSHQIVFVDYKMENHCLNLNFSWKLQWKKTMNYAEGVMIDVWKSMMFECLNVHSILTTDNPLVPDPTQR